MESRPPGAAPGFTLIELITVIVLVGILAVVGARFIDLPVRGYVDLARRTELVDAAEMALRGMQREIRAALPNSIRTAPEGNGNGTVLELIPVRNAGRYRERPGPGIGHPDCRLQFTLADTSFAVTHDFGGVAPGDRIVVSNWTTDPASAANAYTGGNVGTAGGFEANAPLCGGEDRISLAPPRRFPYASTFQRFFVIGDPVVYLCDTAAGTLTRHEGHGLVADQTAVDTAVELGGGALVADHVAACTMTYVPGTPQRAGLVTLDLTLADGGEQIRLLHQVHVVNTP